MLQTAWLLPQKGFRRWAPARPVSRPSRQPATGPPGSYPDRTYTGRRRRASDQVMIAGQPPPDALGARNFGLTPGQPHGPVTALPRNPADPPQAGPAAGNDGPQHGQLSPIEDFAQLGEQG